MMDYRGTWGFYVYPGHQDRIFHPDDAYDELLFRGDKVFYCADVTDDGYLVLRFDEETYQVIPDLFHPLPAPQLRFGDPVRDLVLERDGVIAGIYWHWTQKREFYGLKIGERVSKRWYWLEELQVIPPDEPTAG